MPHKNFFKSDGLTLSFLSEIAVLFYCLSYMPKRTSYKQINIKMCKTKQNFNLDLTKHQREELYTPNATTQVYYVYRKKCGEA